MSARRKWSICPACNGDGCADSLGVVDRDDFDDEEWQRYLAGQYEARCSVCNGRGRVPEFDTSSLLVRAGSDGQNVRYADADDASEHYLNMAEGLA